MTIDEFLDKLEGVQSVPGGWQAICPAHDDNSPSLQITEREDGSIGVHCHAYCPTEAVMAALGCTMAHLFPGGSSMGTPEAIYPYLDENRDLLFEAVRFPGKKFRQRHYDEDGELVYNLEGVRRVLFRLPEVIAASHANATIYVCEGEKDVLNLADRGYNATCNPMGAGKWRDEYCAFLLGANVVVIADKDEPGRHHAEQVRDSLRQANVLVSVVEAREGKDASDHLEAGYGVDDFAPVVERVRRGIVTAREMAANAKVHLKAQEGAEAEYVIPDFALGKHALAMRPGRMYLLGGYTGDGKTTLALQITRRLCSLQVPPRVGFFSLEMSSDDLTNRLLQHWGLPLYKIEHPWLFDEKEQFTYNAAVAQIEEWPLEVTYDSGIDAESICETTRDRDYDFIFVDHIHRFNWGAERRTLEREIGLLNNLALDYNIPVFVLAQFRNYERGRGFMAYPRPSLQDFKETGSLGQEAAMAMAVWRHRAQDTTQYDPKGFSNLIVLKNRYGPCSEQLLQLDTNRMLFVPPTHGGQHDDGNPTEPPATGAGGDVSAY